MFIQAERELGLPIDVATEALNLALADGGLVSESRRAVAEGMEFVMAVGPRSGRFPAKEVIVQLLPGRRSGPRFVVPLRWETTGHAGRLFPSLDADLELTAGEQPSTSRLSIIGRYEPPLGALGQTIDRAVMSRVASATMNTMLREVAAHLERLAG
jgi:hypothetical protein